MLQHSWYLYSKHNKPGFHDTEETALAALYMPLSLRLSVLNLVISVTKIFPQYPPERHVLSKLFISTSRMQSCKVGLISAIRYLHVIFKNCTWNRLQVVTSCMLGRDDTIRIVPSLVLNFTVIMLLPIATSSSSALNLTSEMYKYI